MRPESQDILQYQHSLKYTLFQIVRLSGICPQIPAIRLYLAKEPSPFMMKGKIGASPPSSSSCDDPQGQRSSGSQIVSRQRRSKNEASLGCVLSGPSRPREAKRRPNLIFLRHAEARRQSAAGDTIDRHTDHELHYRFAVSTEVGGPLV